MDYRLDLFSGSKYGIFSITALDAYVTTLVGAAIYPVADQLTLNLPSSSSRVMLCPFKFVTMCDEIVWDFVEQQGTAVNNYVFATLACRSETEQ